MENVNHLEKLKHPELIIAFSLLNLDKNLVEEVIKRIRNELKAREELVDILEEFVKTHES